jgi:hypothetical protein
MKSIRRLLVSAPEDGWDRDVDAGDRSLMAELRSIICEMARFRQARSAVAPIDTDTAGDSSFMFGGAEPPDDDQVEYTLTANNELECYFFNVLLPRNVDLTADRLGHLCSLAPSHILPTNINFGVDTACGRPYIVVRVNKKSNATSFQSRILIMERLERLGSAPAFRITTGLPLTEGVSVTRTQEGTLINNQGAQRAAKRPRTDVF